MLRWSLQTKDNAHCCSLDHLGYHAITIIPNSGRVTAQITDRQQLKCCSGKALTRSTLRTSMYRLGTRNFHFIIQIFFTLSCYKDITTIRKLFSVPVIFIRFTGWRHTCTHWKQFTCTAIHFDSGALAGFEDSQ